MEFATLAAQVDRACVQALGEPVTVGATAGVRGIWRQPYAEAFEVASSGPTLEYRLADAPVSVGTTVVRGAATWRVRAIEPDGTGWVLLRLELLP